VETLAFSADTAFAFGRDTLRACAVPGHAAGTAVYLFRGVLFVGDAMTYSRSHGFTPTNRGVIDDRAVATQGLAAPWKRLPRGAARYVCTAHARCAPYSAHFGEL
jgi:glyoxylase-like metal-dependent hydrolase (beta-lactamase superfamily II)